MTLSPTRRPFLDPFLRRRFGSLCLLLPCRRLPRFRIPPSLCLAAELPSNAVGWCRTTICVPLCFFAGTRGKGTASLKHHRQLAEDLLWGEHRTRNLFISPFSCRRLAFSAVVRFLLQGLACLVVFEHSSGARPLPPSSQHLLSCLRCRFSLLYFQQLLRVVFLAVCPAHTYRVRIMRGCRSVGFEGQTYRHARGGTLHARVTRTGFCGRASRGRFAAHGLRWYTQ